MITFLQRGNYTVASCFDMRLEVRFFQGPIIVNILEKGSGFGDGLKQRERVFWI